MAEKFLDVPYFSQLDNKLNPSGACNVTSCAMAAYYKGVRGDGNGQLEDQMYRRCEQRGWSRHNPVGLKLLLESYGLTDDLRYNGTFADIRSAIDNGKPVIVHGYFTRFGHIVLLRGYDNTGFYVNDPNGEYFSWGYDTLVSGENLHYSKELIARTCSPESVNSPADILIHIVERKRAQPSGK